MSQRQSAGAAESGEEKKYSRNSGKDAMKKGVQAMVWSIRGWGVVNWVKRMGGKGRNVTWDEGRATQSPQWEAAECAGEWKEAAFLSQNAGASNRNWLPWNLSPTGNDWKDTEKFTALLGRPRKPRESTPQKPLANIRSLVGMAAPLF